MSNSHPCLQCVFLCVDIGTVTYRKSLYASFGSWPMQEGLVLKKRFDDVFESTRYTKALEALNKTKKEIVSKSKDLKAELMEQGAHLQATLLTKNELENYLENQENTTSELDRLKTELEGNQDRVIRITLVH